MLLDPAVSKLGLELVLEDRGGWNCANSPNSLVLEEGEVISLLSICGKASSTKVPFDAVVVGMVGMAARAVKSAKLGKAPWE